MFRCRPRDRVSTGPIQRWLIALVLLAAACAVHADDGLVARVGRVAAVEGELYRATPDASADWTAVDLNFPVTGGDDLRLAEGGRAEIDYGGGRIRFAGGTRLRISRLDDARLALFVQEGHVVVRVRWLEPGEVVAIDTPHVQVQLDRPGRYRIDVPGDRGGTAVAVGEGEAQLWLPDGTLRALPGQQVEVTGAQGERPDVLAAGSADDLDAWSAARDRRLSGRAYAYAPRDMIGAGDLDAYGTWESSPVYGTVWYPTVLVADWAPYSVGRWTWLPAWGWTWVDAAPWGYAPFHYGRWVYVDNRWGWCPGPRPLRPVWAPALVAWYGGSGWGLPVVAGQAYYGWAPLGWGEPYVPAWSSCDAGCWNRFNRPFAVDPGARHVPIGRFANAAVPGGLTAVAGGLLASGQPVTGHRVPVPFELVRSAPALAGLPSPAMARAPGRSPSGLRDEGGLASMGARPFASEASPWKAPPGAAAPAARPYAGGAGLTGGGGLGGGAGLGGSAASTGGAGLTGGSAGPAAALPRAIDDGVTARRPAVEGSRRVSPASGLATTAPARVDRWPAPDMARRAPETGVPLRNADRRPAPRTRNGLASTSRVEPWPSMPPTPHGRAPAHPAPESLVRPSPARHREAASSFAPRVASVAPPAMPAPGAHAAAPVWTLPPGAPPAAHAAPPGLPPAVSPPRGAPPASHVAPARAPGMPARSPFER